MDEVVPDGYLLGLSLAVFSAGLLLRWWPRNHDHL